MGGSSFSSRDNNAITAAKLPPADDPPTIRPFWGLAFSDFALEIAHFTASQQSLTPTGNGCSGANLKTLIEVTVQSLESLPVIDIHTNGSELFSEHSAVHVLVCQVSCTPTTFVKHQYQWIFIIRYRFLWLIDFNRNASSIPSCKVVGSFDDIVRYGPWNRIEVAKLLEMVCSARSYLCKIRFLSREGDSF